MLLAASIAAAVYWTSPDDWRPWSLFASLLALALVGQFLSVRTGAVQIGPAFVSTALAMVLLGPAPAAVIAVSAVLAWSIKARTPAPLVFNNVVALTTYPVVGALLFKAFGDPGEEQIAELSTAAIVFGVYLLTNFLNFLLIVGYLCLRDRASLVAAIRRLYLPVVPWEVATGTLDRRHRARLPGGRPPRRGDALGDPHGLPLPARLGGRRPAPSATSCARRCRSSRRSTTA